MEKDTKVDKSTMKRLLEKNEVFKYLPGTSLERIVDTANFERVQRTAVVLRAVKEPGVLLVTRGLVRLSLAAGSIGEMNEVSIGLRAAGELVGEGALYGPLEIPIRGIAVTEPVEILRLHAPTLLEVLEAEGSEAAHAKWSRLLAKSTFESSRRVVLLTMAVKTRLAWVVADLAERFGDEMEDGTTLIPVRFTRAELASLSNATVETVIRILSQWSREGIVTTNEGNLVVHDLKRLVQMSPELDPFAGAA